MERVELIKPDFPKDAFAGTATYYARYRVAYPKVEAVPNPRGFGWKPDTDINLRHVM